MRRNEEGRVRRGHTCWSNRILVRFCGPTPRSWSLNDTMKGEEVGLLFEAPFLFLWREATGRAHRGQERKSELGWGRTRGLTLIIHTTPGARLKPGLTVLAMKTLSYSGRSQLAHISEQLWAHSLALCISLPFGPSRAQSALKIKDAMRPNPVPLSADS